MTDVPLADEQRMNSQTLSMVRRDAAKRYSTIVNDTDMDRVLQGISRISESEGLGAVLLTAWQHGLNIGHIPIQSDQPAVEILRSTGSCPYQFVHVPIRAIRRQEAELAQRGIVNPLPDSQRLIYHNDGVIYPEKCGVDLGVTTDQARQLLHALSQAGVIEHVDERDPRIVAFAGTSLPSDTSLYIVSRAPAQLSQQSEQVDVGLLPALSHAFIESYLRQHTPCFFCSSTALTPHEVLFFANETVAGSSDVAIEPRHRYQCGFTFAPFGDPEHICHFLAWDEPSGGANPTDMSPNTSSLFDVLTLTQGFNDALREYCHQHNLTSPPPLTGVCNHWAGNSIAHQHFQFFCLPSLAVQCAAENTSILLDMGEWMIGRVSSWPTPAYLLTASTELPVSQQISTISQIGTLLQQTWIADQHDVDGAQSSRRTVNTVAFILNDRPVALIFPRYSDRLDAHSLLIPAEKRNAGVLEMMGYFIIDDTATFNALCSLTPLEREQLGDAWLASLAPDNNDIVALESTIVGIYTDFQKDST